MQEQVLLFSQNLLSHLGKDRVKPDLRVQGPNQTKRTISSWFTREMIITGYFVKPSALCLLSHAAHDLSLSIQPINSRLGFMKENLGLCTSPVCFCGFPRIQENYSKTLPSLSPACNHEGCVSEGFIKNQKLNTETEAKPSPTKSILHKCLYQ